MGSGRFKSHIVQIKPDTGWIPIEKVKMFKSHIVQIKRAGLLSPATT